MKNLLVLALMVFGIIGLTRGQEDARQIKLAVAVPTYSLDGLSASHIGKINTKIQRMVSRDGMISTDYINDFVVVPEFEIFEEDVIPGTYGDIHHVVAELTLKVYNTKTKALLAAPFPIELEGESRTSKNDAITKAISRIKTSGSKIEEFISNIKTKILAYYQTHCENIYNEAYTLMERGAVEQAMNLLWSLPSNSSGSCYDQVDELLNQAYELYSAQKCQQILSESEGAIRNGDTAYAKALLNTIRSGSSCYDDAQRILGELSKSTPQKTEGDKEKRDTSDKINKRKERTVEAVAESYSKQDDKEQLCALGIGVDCD